MRIVVLGATGNVGTSTLEAPWMIIRSEKKHLARMEAMKLILNSVDYEGRDPDIDGADCNHREQRQEYGHLHGGHAPAECATRERALPLSRDQEWQP